MLHGLCSVCGKKTHTHTNSSQLILFSLSKLKINDGHFVILQPLLDTHSFPGLVFAALSPHKLAQSPRSISDFPNARHPAVRWRKARTIEGWFRCQSKCMHWKTLWMDQRAGEFWQRHRSLSQFVASGYIQRMDSDHSRCGRFTCKSLSFSHFSLHLYTYPGLIVVVVVVTFTFFRVTTVTNGSLLLRFSSSASL